MSLNFKKVIYSDLNARQKENYNYQKISAILADYGFTTHRMTDDWQGADFIAQHLDGETFLKVQLKGRMCFYKKYLGKDIFIAFRSKSNEWFLYDHDKVLDETLKKNKSFGKTSSWKDKGGYSFPSIKKEYLEVLEPYKL